MNLGREIIAEAIRYGSLKPYLEAGMTAAWVKSSETFSEAVFDGTDRDAWLRLLEHQKRHKAVMTEALLRKDFPAASYRLPDSDYKASELIELAQREVRGMIVGELVEQLVDLHDAQEFREADAVLTDTLGLMRKGIKDHEETAVDAADFDVEMMMDEVMDEGIPLGLEPMDEQLNGIQPTWLVTIVGRQKAGKSTLMINGALAAWEKGFDVLFYSVELDVRFLRQRLYAIGANVSPSRMRRGTLRADERKRVRDFQARMAAPDAPMFKISKKTSMFTIDDIEADVERYRPHGVYVDGFYFMRDRITRKSAGSDWQANENLAEELKALAMQHQIAVFTSTQAQEKQQGSEKKQKEGIEARTIQAGTGLLKASDLVLGYDKNGIVNEIFNRWDPVENVLVTWDWDDMTLTVVPYQSKEDARADMAEGFLSEMDQAA